MSKPFFNFFVSKNFLLIFPTTYYNFMPRDAFYQNSVLYSNLGKSGFWDHFSYLNNYRVTISYIVVYFYFIPTNVIFMIIFRKGSWVIKIWKRVKNGARIHITFLYLNNYRVTIFYIIVCFST